MKKHFLLGLAIFAIAIIPSAASAVEYGGIGGRPANPRADNPRSESIFIYELEPGASAQDGVRVFNNTDTVRTIAVGAVDSSLASDGAFACAQANEPKVSVGRWITLEKDTVTVAPGKSAVVNFTITAPDSANVGEQSGCITMQDTAATEAPEQGGGVVLSFRSAIRVAVTVPGEIVKGLSIAGVTLAPSPSDGKLYTATPSIRNSGNVSLDTNITVTLTSLFGIPADSKEGTYPVIAGSTASWNYEFTSPFWGGLYRADVVAEYNDNVNDSIGEDSAAPRQTVSGSSSYVYIAPAPAAALIQLIALALVAAGIVFGIRNLLHKRKVAKYWRLYEVKEGDTLQKIAKNKHVSWKTLARSNKIRAPYSLEPGQKIKVPPKSE